MNEDTGWEKKKKKKKQRIRTSLWEELRVDVFKSFFVDDPTGTFLEDKNGTSYSPSINEILGSNLRLASQRQVITFSGKIYSASTSIP